MKTLCLHTKHSRF